MSSSTACDSFQCTGFSSYIVCMTNTSKCSSNGVCLNVKVTSGRKFVSGCNSTGDCWACTTCAGNYGGYDCGRCDTGYSLNSNCTSCKPGFQTVNQACEPIPSSAGSAPNSTAVIVIAVLAAALFLSAIVCIVRRVRRKQTDGSSSQLGLPLLDTRTSSAPSTQPLDGDEQSPSASSTRPTSPPHSSRCWTRCGRASSTACSALLSSSSDSDSESKS